MVETVTAGGAGDDILCSWYDLFGKVDSREKEGQWNPQLFVFLDHE